MVTIRWRLHMAGSAQEFGVVDGIVSTVATGLPVMKIEVHRCAAALTPCSAFCLHLCIAFVARLRWVLMISDIRLSPLYSPW